MKAHKLIVENREDQFEIKVNHLLREGWLVQPGSLVISSATATGSYGGSMIAVQEFAVVLEKDIDGVKP